MARNVGKKRGAQPRPAAGGNTAGKKSLIAFTGGTLFGLALAGGVYLLDLLPTSMELRAHEQARTGDTHADNTEPVAQDNAASEKKPVTFQFYDMLTKQETAVPVAGKETSRPAGTPPPVPPVVIAPPAGNPASSAVVPMPPAAPVAPVISPPPAVTAATPATAPPVAPAVIPVPPSATSSRFALQAGSFATRAEADRRRGELLLSGHNVNVQQATTEKGDIRFRVMVGPFDNEASLKKAQQQLAGMKVDTFAVKTK